MFVLQAIVMRQYRMMPHKEQPYSVPGNESIDIYKEMFYQFRLVLEGKNEQTVDQW